MNWNDIFHYQDGAIYWKTENSQHHASDRAGGPTSDGYLRVWANGRSHKVHRIIWEMHNGTIPEGMEVDGILTDGRKMTVALYKDEGEALTDALLLAEDERVLGYRIEPVK